MKFGENTIYLYPINIKYLPDKHETNARSGHKTSLKPDLKPFKTLSVPGTVYPVLKYHGCSIQTCYICERLENFKTFVATFILELRD